MQNAFQCQRFMLVQSQTFTKQVEMTLNDATFYENGSWFRKQQDQAEFLDPIKNSSSIIFEFNFFEAQINLDYTVVKLNHEK